MFMILKKFVSSQSLQARKLQKKRKTGYIIEAATNWNQADANTLLFTVGEFATQTCFQGRYGEEMGSDQFGGCLMFHPKDKDSLEAVGLIESVEFSYVGQAFR